MNTFEDLGYRISKKFLHKYELKQIEDEFEQFNYKNKFVFDPLVIRPNMAKVFFNLKLIADLKEILGDNFILLPDSSLHYGRRNVMHTDNTSLLAEGIKLFDDDPTFKMVTIGTYLQASTGGNGLNVVPGSHLLVDRFAAHRSKNVKNRLLNLSRKCLSEKVYKYIHPRNFTGVDLQTDYGDSVIFDIRIEHRSQYPKFPYDFIQETGIRKAVFHRACSSNELTAQKYVSYLQGKPGYDYLKNPQRKIPDSLMKLAASHGVVVM